MKLNRVLFINTVYKKKQITYIDLNKNENITEEIVTAKDAEIYAIKAVHKLLKIAEPEIIVTVTGPGSFTGIRIGIAITKALQLALNVPAIGISTLALLIESQKIINGKFTVFANMNEVFVVNVKNRQIKHIDIENRDSKKEYIATITDRGVLNFITSLTSYSLTVLLEKYPLSPCYMKKSRASEKITAFELKTPFGYYMLFEFAGGKLFNIEFHLRSLCLKKSNSYLLPLLKRYFKGEHVDFLRGMNLWDMISDCGYTEFEKKVFEEVFKIPPGVTRTYGEVSKRLFGTKKYARAVGNALKKNRTPLIIPCHRVVGASKQSGGFSAAYGKRLKKELLDFEKKLFKR